MTTPKYDVLWVAFDIEANGPNPIENCAIQYGFAVIAPEKLDLSPSKWSNYKDAVIDQVSWPVKPDRPADPVTLKEFWSKHQAIYDRLISTGRPIKQVMRDFAEKLVEWKSMCKSLRFCAAPTSYDVMWLATDYAEWNPSLDDGIAGITKPAFPHRMDCTSTLRTSVVEQIYRTQEFNGRGFGVNKHALSKADITKAVGAICNMWNLPHTHDAADDALHQGLEHCVLNRIIISASNLSASSFYVTIRHSEGADGADNASTIGWTDGKIDHK